MKFQNYPFYYHSLLLRLDKDQKGRKGDELNGYQLVVFFMEKNPDALYFIDEVPLIPNGMCNLKSNQIDIYL